MVISVILIQHFLGILCATKFRVTRIFEKFISWLHRHPSTSTNKLQEIFPVQIHEIHGESQTHINVHTSSVPHNLVFSPEFLTNVLLENYLIPLLEDFYLCDGP